MTYGLKGNGDKRADATAPLAGGEVLAGYQHPLEVGVLCNYVTCNYFMCLGATKGQVFNFCIMFDTRIVLCAHVGIIIMIEF